MVSWTRVSKPPNGISNILDRSSRYFWHSSPVCQTHTHTHTHRHTDHAICVIYVAAGHIYALLAGNALSLTKSDLQSIDFVINRFFYEII